MNDVDSIFEHKHVNCTSASLTLNDGRGPHSQGLLQMDAPYMDFCAHSGTARFSGRTLLRLRGINPEQKSMIVLNASLDGGALVTRNGILKSLQNVEDQYVKAIHLWGTSDVGGGLSLSIRAENMKIDVSEGKIILQGSVDAHLHDGTRITEGIRTSTMMYNFRHGQLCLAEKGLQTYAGGRMAAALIARSSHADEGFLKCNLIKID